MRCREANEGELLPRENLGAKMSNWILETLTGILMVDCNRGNEKYGLLNRYGQLNPTRFWDKPGNLASQKGDGQSWRYH